jgi:hypothetical protein
MKLFVPGEERLSRGEPMKYHAVFSEAHATELNQSGFTQVVILFHPPDLPLQGLSELAQEGGGSGRPRKKPASSRQVVIPNAEPLLRQEEERDKARKGALKKLNIPSDVPSWIGCRQLVAMMEEPFTLNANLDVFYSPVYMWPSGHNQRKQFGNGWLAAKISDALSRVYQDYYNLVVRNEEAFAELQSGKDGKGKRGHIQTAKDCVVP